MKKSFIVHVDSLDVIDALTDEQCGELLKAMRSYHNGKEFDLSPIVKVAFSPFKNQFDRDQEKYEKTCERNKHNGAGGGRPKNKALRTLDGVLIPADPGGKHFIYLIHDNVEDQYKIGETQNLIQRRYDIKRPTNDLDIVCFGLTSAAAAQRIENEIINNFQDVRISGDWFKFTDCMASEVVNYISQITESVSSNPKKADNDNDSDSDNKKKKTKRFAAPSINELKAYVKEKDLNVGAEAFIDFYASKGWKVGTSPMKDWKAAARNWSKRNNDNNVNEREASEKNWKDTATGIRDKGKLVGLRESDFDHFQAFKAAVEREVIRLDSIR